MDVPAQPEGRVRGETQERGLIAVGVDESHRYDESTPYRHADGRPKMSPDETSLFGLNAVWSEVESGSRSQHASSHRRSRHASRRSRRPLWPLSLGIGGGLLCVVVMIWLLAAAF